MKWVPGFVYVLHPNFFSLNGVCVVIGIFVFLVTTDRKP